MCRYSGNRYRDHHVCFKCRVAFKHWGHSDGRPCPTCRSPMVCLGMDFHRPAKGNVKEWRKLEELVAAGVRFQSCGCGGPGFRPQRLAEVPLFLQGRQRREALASEAQRLRLLTSFRKQGLRTSDAARILDAGTRFRRPELT